MLHDFNHGIELHLALSNQTRNVKDSTEDITVNLTLTSMPTSTITAPVNNDAHRLPISISSGELTFLTVISALVVGFVAGRFSRRSGYRHIN